MDASTRMGIALTTLGVVFFFYCMYLERRHAKRIRHRKEKKLLDKISGQQMIPEFRNPREQQTFILHEIQRAEELMMRGRYENAIVHFANAIAVCVDPHRLLLALKENLPPSDFDLLLKVLADKYGRKSLLVGYCNLQLRSNNNAISFWKFV